MNFSPLQEICRRQSRHSGGGGVLEGGVGVAYQLAVVLEWEHLAVVDVFLLEDGPLGHRVIHILLLEITLAGETAHRTDFIRRVVLEP